MTTTVHLADDQALLRAGFAMVINSQPDMTVTGQSGTGADALTAAREHQPDVILMDIRMPEMDGLEGHGEDRRGPHAHRHSGHRADHLRHR